MQNRSLFLCVLMTALPVTASAEVYKWVDAQNQVHYSELPPVGKSHVTLAGLEKAPSYSDSVREENIKNQLDQADKNSLRRKEERKLNKLSQARAEQFKKNCENATRDLETLTARSRVLVQDPETGEYSRIDEEQRTARIRQSEKDIQYFCEG